MPRKSNSAAILSSIENLTELVGKLQEEIKEIKSSKLDLSTAEIATGQLPEEKSESLSSRNSPETIKQLEGIFATNKVNIFGTTDLTIFEERLKNITTPDLQDLAIKAGVNPTEAEYVIKANLRGVFLNDSAQNGLREIPKPRNIPIDPKNPKHLKMIQALKMSVGA